MAVFFDMQNFLDTEKAEFKVGKRNMTAYLWREQSGWYWEIIGDNAFDSIMAYDRFNTNIEAANDMVEYLSDAVKKLPYFTEASMVKKTAQLQYVDSTMFKKFEDTSIFTFEGMDTSDANIQEMKDSLGLTDKNILYVYTGKMMNDYYGLTGDNAYPADLNFISISDFYDPMVKINVGARWFDDIVDNNRLRQNEIDNKTAKKAIFVKNVGIDQDGNGTGIDPSGNPIKFILSDSDRAQLKSVLYSDLAINFSGVDIEEDEIIASKKAQATESIFNKVYSALKLETSKIGIEAFDALDTECISDVIKDGNTFWLESSEYSECSDEAYDYIIEFIKTNFGLRYLYEETQTVTATKRAQYAPMFTQSFPVELSFNGSIIPTSVNAEMSITPTGRYTTLGSHALETKEVGYSDTTYGEFNVDVINKVTGDVIGKVRYSDVSVLPFIIKTSRKAMRKVSAVSLYLPGPDGNAFNVMGTTRNILKQLGTSKEEIEAVIDDAMSGDYDHLLDVCEEACMGLLVYEGRDGEDDDFYSEAKLAGKSFFVDVNGVKFQSGDKLIDTTVNDNAIYEVKNIFDGATSFIVFRDGKPYETVMNQDQAGVYKIITGTTASFEKKAAAYTVAFNYFHGIGGIQKYKELSAANIDTILNKLESFDVYNVVRTSMSFDQDMTPEQRERLNKITSRYGAGWKFSSSDKPVTNDDNIPGFNDMLNDDIGKLLDKTTPGIN